LSIQQHPAGDAIEQPAPFCDPEIAYFETDYGVRWLDGVCLGSGLGMGRVSREEGGGAQPEQLLEHGETHGA
jgi:hypothetical protein